MQASRSVAVDMESATNAANGPLPHPLCDAAVRLGQAAARLTAALRSASAFYETSKRQHLGITLACLDRVRCEHPDGLPSHDIRSADEPLFGTDGTG